MSAGPQEAPTFTLCCARVRGKNKNTFYPDDRVVHNLPELLEAVQYDHTPGAFTDRHRNNKKWCCTECLTFDVDNTEGGPLVTPETIKQDFPRVVHYIVFSRHHNMPKDGKPAAPRFHVYFPTGLLADAAAVGKLLADVAGTHQYFDGACLDLARFYFGVEHPTGDYVPGALTLDQFMEQQHATPVVTVPAVLPASMGITKEWAGRNDRLKSFAFPMNYINEARRIVTNYFASAAPSEQLRRETAQELRLGHITEGYARQLNLSADNEELKLRHDAEAKLQALSRQFATAASRADTPDGNALQGGDYRLLADNFPMSVEEFSALCERNKNNPTLLRKAMEYGDKHGGMAPYAKKYYRSASERTALFNKFIRYCSGVLEAEPTSPARGDAYWNMIAREVAPWATL